MNWESLPFARELEETQTGVDGLHDQHIKPLIDANRSTIYFSVVPGADAGCARVTFVFQCF